MYKWEQSEIVETHRLTVAMVWALLGVGTVRPSTWAALTRRGLVERADDGGYRLTATGQDVADELYNLTTESSASERPSVASAREVLSLPEVPDPREPEDSPTVIEPRTVTAAEVGAGDVLVWRGERRRVLGTWTDLGDVVISTYEGTLTMPPGTPVRVDPVEQLALVG